MSCRGFLLLFAGLPILTFASPVSLCRSYPEYTCSATAGFGTTQVYVETMASAGQWQFGYSGAMSGTATIDMYGYTDGPVQPGYIEFFDENASTDGNGFQFMTADIGGYRCSAPDPLACDLPFDQLLPFTLGVPFAIDLSASASIFNFATQGASAFGEYGFSIYEQASINGYLFQGPAVTIFDAATVPEPSSLTGIMIAMGLFAVNRARSLRR